MVNGFPDFPLNVFVHPIDTIKHPDQPPGWRWAIHVGENPSDMSTCLQAGWAHDSGEALLFGHQTAAAVENALKVTGVGVVPYDPQPLLTDPTPY